MTPTRRAILAGLAAVWLPLPVATAGKTRSWPSQDTTGPKGALKSSLEFTSSADGQIIENLDVAGPIFISHKNVTVRNCRIKGPAFYGIEGDAVSGVNATIEDCEFLCEEPTDFFHQCIEVQSGWIVRRCNLAHGSNGISIGGTGAIIEDCYIHDLRGTEESHMDGIQGTGGFRSLTIRRNRINGKDTSCIILQNEGDGFGGVVIEDNLLDGTEGVASHLYIRGDKTPTEITDAIVTGNVFVGTPNAGYYDLQDGPRKLVWKRNTLAGGRPLNL